MTRIGTLLRLSLSRKQGLVPSGVTLVPTTLEIVSGQSQSATVSQQLSAPLIVRVLDQNGNPFAGRTVSAAVNSGGGAITPASAVTDASGQASFTATVGSVAGFNSYTVTSSGLSGSPVVFTATGVAAGQSAALLFSEPVADASFALRGWYDNPNPPRSTVSPPPGATGSILYTWTTGQSVPTNGAASRVLFPATDELFIRFQVRFNLGWRGSGVDFHPHLVQIGCDADDPFFAVAKSFMEAYLDFVYFAGLGGTRCEFSLQDSENIRVDSLGSVPATSPEQRAVSGYNGQQGDASPGRFDTYDNGGGDYRNYRVLYPNGGIVPTDNTGWTEFSLYMKCNTVTSGVANIDGKMRLWKDGALIRTSDTLLFRAGAYATRRFNQLILAPYIQPGSGSPINQSLNIGKIELWNGIPAGFGSPSVSASAGDGQSATTSSAVAVRPAVLVRDALGNPVAGVAVAFAVTGGGGSVTGATATSNASGIATVGSWTLGATAGTNTLTATVPGYSGSPVTFTATATASGAWFNPTGVGANYVAAETPTLITNQPWTTLNSDGWINDGNGDPGVVTDATSPEGGRVLSFVYPGGGAGSGYAGGSAPGCQQKEGFGPYRFFYKRYPLWVSANFQGHNSQTNKVGFNWANGGPAFFLSLEGTGSGTLTYMPRLQISGAALPPPATGSPTDHATPNQSSPQQTVTRGQWVDVEERWTCNTGASANGAVRLYINGSKVAEYTNVVIGNPIGGGIDITSIRPIWGGVGDNVNTTMEMRVGRVVCYGGN